MANLDAFAARMAMPAVRWFALLLLCAAYLQGGFTKLVVFDGALAEMRHFGLTPPTLFAIATIALEIVASIALVVGYYRWLAALALAAFTLAATFVANRFWDAAPAERFMMTNAFFEHLGLVGGFLLVAWHDLRQRQQAP
jgi:uncharacterized membrane protein YphA (DoxX/SURF4 family)